MEELQKQIIAVQLIQELIVDVLDEYGVISRTEFERRLKERVDNLNKSIEEYSKKAEEIKTKNKTVPYISNIIGEA
jgi:hypothetical protein